MLYVTKCYKPRLYVLQSSELESQNARINKAWNFEHSLHQPVHPPHHKQLQMINWSEKSMNTVLFEK